MLRRLALALAATLAAAASASASPPVEVSHPVGDFLRRLEEKGVIATGFLSTWPRPEAEVAEALAEAAAPERADRLNAWDRRRLERFRDEFDPDRKRRSRLHYEDGSPFVLHGTTEYFTGIYLRDSLPRNDVHAFGSFTPAVQAAYGDFTWLTASATVAMERHLHARFTAGYQYEPSMGMPYNVNRDGLEGSDKSVVTFDGFRVMLGVGNEHIRLEAGQDWNRWGPGRWQHSTLGPRPHFWIADAPDSGSPGTGFNGTEHPGAHRRGYRYPGEGPPMPQLRLHLGSAHWEYTKVVAARKGLWKDSSASLIAHRLQVRVGAFRFGGTELLAVGTRAPDAILFLPGIPLKFAEHESSDRDNSAMSFDAEWIARGHGRMYGELFVDDFSGSPLSYWGNKLAWVLGGAWHDPLGVPAELQAEYAHVDPWVYGHHLTNTQMQSYGALLGSGLPPNSRSVRTAALFPLPAGVEGRVSWHLQQRDLKSAGSSIFDGRPNLVGVANDTPKAFLEEDVETRHAVEAGLSWRWRRHVQLVAAAGWLAVENFRGEAGESLSTPMVSGEVWLRY